MAEDIAMRVAEVDNITVGLPVQRYFIAATVMKPSRIALANEFALRLLRIADRVDLESFRQFFGFNTDEALQLLAELHGKGWIDARDGLALSGFGDALFRSGSDEAPVLHETLPFRRTLTFETISYAPIVSRGVSRAARNIIMLQAPDIGERGVESIVSTSFQDAYNLGFDDSAGPSRDPRSQVVCGVNEIAYRGSDVLEVSVPVEFDLEAHKLSYNYSHMDGYSTPLDTSSVVAALSSTLRNLRYTVDNALSLGFVSEFDGGVLSAYADQRKGIFNLEPWLEQCDKSQDQGGVVRFVGSLARQEVRAKLSKLFEDRLKRKASTSPLIVVRPAVEQWARNTATQSFFHNLMKSCGEGVSSYLLCSLGDLTEHEFGKRFGPAVYGGKSRRPPVFHVGMITNPECLPGGVEMLFCGGILCVILYAAHEDQVAPVPVGFATSDRNLLRSAKATLLRHLNPIARTVKIAWSTTDGTPTDVREDFTKAIDA